MDVPVQDMVLRITGVDDLYEEARAAGMQFWEQIQSHAIRQPAFRSSKRPLPVPETAPAIVREMAEMAARAGVGPMFTFQGALIEYVGRALARFASDIAVSCGGDHYVVARKRARLSVHPASSAARTGLAVIVRPELGPHGIYTSLGRSYAPSEASEGIAVVAGSCILADAAAAGASAILARPQSLQVALAYLQSLRGVHGGVVIRGDRIGVAGALELAA